MLILPRRPLRAPTANGAVLAEPAAADLPGLVADNRARLTAAPLRIDGIPLADYRRAAQAEIVAAARHYLAEQHEPLPADFAGGPVVATGHQPELFHPGVWVKNFALNRLARQVGGTPIHLIVDNDTLKSTALKLPVWPGATPTNVTLESVPFDMFTGEEPYETRGVQAPEMFATFAERVRDRTRNWGFRPLLEDVWPQVLARPAEEPLGRRFAAVRRTQERAWGCHNLELPVSRLADTTAFRRFACQVLTDLPRFRAVYNAAIEAYRAANKIRSLNHPAPTLAARESALEAPFWRATPTGRTRVFQLPGAVPNFDQLRPRALTLTLFARLAFADTFLHGIGGGKYDEVTDLILQNYFGIRPPGFQVLSATVQLPVPNRERPTANPGAVRQQIRDAQWNPQRHLPTEVKTRPEVMALLVRRAALLATEPAGTPARRQWFRALREVVTELRPFAATPTPDDRTTAEAHAADEAHLTRRDLAWVLYPEAELANRMRPFLAS